MTLVSMNWPGPSIDRSVTVTCEVLGVPRSGYYASLERPPSKRALANEELTERIRTIYTDSRGDVWGAADLR